MFILITAPYKTNTQWDLSCRQLQWQEFMSQNDMTIVYILEDNSVADVLLQVPDGAFPEESIDK